LRRHIGGPYNSGVNEHSAFCEVHNVTQGPFTVDDIFGMPDDANRYEVLGGSLFVVPASSPKHQYVADELRAIFRSAIPSGVFVVTAAAVRLPGSDGPVPDVVVSTSHPTSVRRGFEAGAVHTVVEVVSPSNAMVDRAYKRELYAEAGIPCYWRVEIEPWRGYDGALPLIAVRVQSATGWRTFEAAAGAVSSVPLAIGRSEDGQPIPIDIPIDPAVLTA
jgi:Uma2 family endonuclease